MTYRKLTTLVRDQEIDIFNGIVFDESTKLMNPTSQRSQAASILVEEMRKQNPDCFVIEMSGAPAPKDPTCWWHQAEIAKPGFLKEGDKHKFKNRLALIKEEQSITGAAYPKLITWKDNERKCNVCGKLPEEHVVGDDIDSYHNWEPSVNEVSYLYERMNGLTLVKFKKDCLDLPDKQFRKIVCEPTSLIRKAEQMIVATEPRAVTALMKLRELSDGFQYKEVETGETETCSLCLGSGECDEYYDLDNPDEAPNLEDNNYGTRTVTCTMCLGHGKINKVHREAQLIKCPKDDVFKDLLDEHEGIGRFVTYAGFQASVDKLVKIALQYDWDVLRVDGRGWEFLSSFNSDIKMHNKDMLREFQHGDRTKICFIGQPGAAGMGLTLTASPSCFFYSNSFNGEDRLQAMDRIHRPGMDKNLGATIIDVVHLETDEYILQNLQKKINLLHMSMGQLRGVHNAS